MGIDLLMQKYTSLLASGAHGTPWTVHYPSPVDKLQNYFNCNTLTEFRVIFTQTSDPWVESDVLGTLKLLTDNVAMALN